MPLYGGTAAVSGSSGSDLATHPMGLINLMNINVNQNNATWGGLIIPAADTTVNSLLCWVYQSGSGDCQGGIYTASDGVLVSSTGTTSCSTTGVKTMTFSSSVSLTKSTAYYLALISTANGCLFCGNGNATSSFNLSPKPSWNINNSQLPATLGTISAQASLIWIQALS